MSRIWTPGRRIWTTPNRQRGFICLPGGGIGSGRPGGGGGGPFDYAAFLSGKSGDAWLADSTHYTDTGRTTVANVNDTIASLTGSAAAYHASQSTSGARPTLMEASSKRYLNFDGGDAMIAGAAGNWNYLHNSADSAYLCVAIRFGSVSNPNAAYTVVATHNASSESNGCWLAYEDRDIVPANNKSRLFVGKSSSGNPAIDLRSADGALSPNTDHVIEYVKSGTTVSVHLDGTQIATGTLSSPTASNSLAALYIGSTSASAALLTGRIYGLIVCNAVPGTSDRTAIKADMSARCVTPPI